MSSLHDRRTCSPEWPKGRNTARVAQSRLTSTSCEVGSHCGISQAVRRATGRCAQASTSGVPTLRGESPRLGSAEAIGSWAYLNLTGSSFGSGSDHMSSKKRYWQICSGGHLGRSARMSVLSYAPTRSVTLPSAPTVQSRLPYTWATISPSAPSGCAGRAPAGSRRPPGRDCRARRTGEERFREQRNGKRRRFRRPGASVSSGRLWSAAASAAAFVSNRKLRKRAALLSSR